MVICPFICLSFRLPVFLHVCQETLPVVLDQHQAQCSYLVCIFLGSSVLDDIRVYHLVTLTLTQWPEKFPLVDIMFDKLILFS